MSVPEVLLNITMSGYLRGVSKNLKVVVRGKGPPFPLKDEKYRKLANFWFENSYKAIANDMKHSGEWKCSEGCGKPATETRAQVIGWFHVDPPFVLIYVFQLCDVGPGSICADKIDEWILDIARDMGMPGDPSTLPSRVGLKYPQLSISCGACHGANHVANAEIFTCSGCKLTRYCSTKCQKQGWKAHKQLCQTVQSVELSSC